LHAIARIATEANNDTLFLHNCSNLKSCKGTTKNAHKQNKTAESLFSMPFFANGLHLAG
jgi:hypothetical protein